MKEPKKVQCEKCKKVSRPATSFCYDCGQFICSTCNDIHLNWEELMSHKVVSMDQLQGDACKCIPLKKVTHLCSRHKDQQLRLYCETCDDIICHDCTVRFHKGHQYDLISDTFEGHKADIAASLEPMKNDMSIVDNILKQLDRRCMEIASQRDLVTTAIHKEVQGFIDILKRREVELVGEIDQVAQGQLKNLAAQRDEIETIQARVGSCLSFVSECLLVGNKGEIMKMKKRVVEQVNATTAEFNADSLALCEEANFEFLTAVDFPNACHRLGDVYISFVTAENSYATLSGKGVEVALVNEKATVCMYTADQNGQRFNSDVTDRTEVELVPESNTNKVKCSVKKDKDNRYVVSYQPTSIGRHQLHIKIDSKHINGSPFTFIVRDPIKRLSKPIDTIDGVKAPWGVAINNKKGEIIVVENCVCVSVYSFNGKKLRSFGRGQFNGPRGVAVDNDGNILVADTQNNCVQKFTSDGKFITAVRNQGKKELQFDYPTGIAIHPVSRSVYVSESLNDRVQVLNPDLTPNSMFGSSSSSGEGKFKQPRGMAFDSAHNVYICEHRNGTQIQIFTANGDHLRWLGEKMLNHPNDVCIDSNDMVYVCDTNNHQICIFSSDGTLLHSFGSKGRALGQFDSPRGIAVDESGLIYVSDFNNDRVQIF